MHGKHLTGKNFFFLLYKQWSIAHGDEFKELHSLLVRVNLGKAVSVKRRGYKVDNLIHEFWHV